MNVKKQILFLLALFTIVSIIAVALVCTVKFVMKSESMVKANMSDVIYLEAGMLEEFFYQQEVNLRTIGDLRGVRELLAGQGSNAFSLDNAAKREMIADLLAVQARQQKYVTTIVVADRQGEIEAAADSSLIGSQAKIPAQEMQTKQTYWVSYTDVISNPEFHEGLRHIWITVPVYEGSKDIGFVSSAIDVNYFVQRIQNMRFFNNGVICITNGKGGVIVSGGNGKSLIDLPIENDLAGLWGKIDLNENASGFLKEKAEKGVRLSYYIKTKPTGWRVITTVGQKTPVFYEEYAVLAVPLFVIGLLLLWIAADHILAKLITQPAATLIRTIRKVESGDVTARFNNRGRNEFGELSASFNKMMDTLAENIEQIRASEERYRVIAEQSDGLIFEYNIVNDECYFSSNWIDKVKFKPDGCGFLEQMLNCEFIHSDDLPQANALLHGIMLDGQDAGRCEVRIKVEDGSYLWCSMRVSAVFDEDQTPIKIIGKITDIDSRKRETEKLRICAQRDMLSELYNKITVERLIDDYLSGEGADGAHALFVIDIDNFKKINDSLGHLTGDRAIKEMSAIVANVFRESDISGRIGGDELIVLMKKFGTRQALEAKAEMLVEAMRHEMEDENGTVYRLSCSVGVSIFPRDGRDYKELFTKADEALYTAKANGKNQCYILGQ